MVQALVTLEENTNRVLNIIKATYDLKDKGGAIDFIVSQYVDDQGQPELRPTFLRKVRQEGRRFARRLQHATKSK